MQYFGEETSWKASTWNIEQMSKDNIKIDRRVVDCEDGKWMELAQYRV
jgi:hypothetical protein